VGTMSQRIVMQKVSYCCGKIISSWVI